MPTLVRCPTSRSPSRPPYHDRVCDSESGGDGDDALLDAGPHSLPRPLPRPPRPRRRQRRVVLLLDLDCFYAQCESVRLGLDPSLPLALLQWDSALAVNYPARAMGIRRGDGYDAIRDKSGGACVALHLPVIPVSRGSDSGGGEGAWIGADVREAAAKSVSAATAAPSPAEEAAAGDEGEGGEPSHRDRRSLEESYASQFCLPRSVREDIFARERNRMRRPHEGKASLERYRTASAMIFQTIAEAMTENLGGEGHGGKFVLERASVDEMFLDVTGHCYDFGRNVWGEAKAVAVAAGGGEQSEGGSSATSSTNEDAAAPLVRCDVEELAQTETVVCGGGNRSSDPRPCDRIGVDDDDENDDDDEIRALRRGCVVARGIRKAVYDRLGFTLSGGISSNKMMAKLGASYGKPNGQAVIFPGAVAEVLNNTEIRKVRFFGGKAGKKVLALLPKGETKMGSVARLLTLDDLVRALGPESGRRAFDAARGIDSEPVTETKGALTKSITSFKSFGRTNMEGLQRWILLLATDVCERVKLDAERNDRYPKSCSIQYIHSNGNDRVSRSLRVMYPRMNSKSRQKEELVKKVQEALIAKGKFPIQRLGLSAVEFEARPKSGGIKSFFHSNCAKHREAETKSKSAFENEGDAPCAGAKSEKRKVPLHSHSDKPEPQPTNKSNTNIVEGFEDSVPMCMEIRSVVSESDQITTAPQKGGVETSEENHNFYDDSQIGRSNDDEQYQNDMELARRTQEQFDREEKELIRRPHPPLLTAMTSATAKVKVSPPRGEQSDLVYARKLQTLYDRENLALESHDASSSPRKRTSPRRAKDAAMSINRMPKKSKRAIESFFKPVCK